MSEIKIKGGEAGMLLEVTQEDGAMTVKEKFTHYSHNI